METRIRELRKSRGWTLQIVADKVGTTPQTVQRLETANMTVSTDWLERFANVFSVPAASLIRDQSSRDIPLLGAVSKEGLLLQTVEDEFVSIAAPAGNSVAIRLNETVGHFRAGAILVGERLHDGNMKKAHGRESLACLGDGAILLCKVICQAETMILAPISPDLPVRSDTSPEWVAPIIMEIHYY